MCGIAGIANLNGLADSDRASLPAMIESLRHRGPDDQGAFNDPHAALGHARLSIIDISTGQQPMCNEDGTIWIVFNGEIYNFPELRRRLVSAGHQFKTFCDTEAIIHLYEEEGDNCVQSLRGMFAFALWDQRKRRLLLARDRLGIKPLYYAQEGRRVAFGSEIKAILEAPGVQRRLDPKALQDYLTYLWIPSPRSIFKDVKKLPAGHVATLDESGFQVKEYWDLRYEIDTTSSADQLADQFLAELEESVKIHLISDVPLGAFLSGGIDSSAVVAMMARLLAKPVVTNSIGFEEDSFNELRYADRVASRFKTEHHRHIVQPDAVEIVELLARHYDEPFADNSSVPTYYVSKMARQSVTVALSGDGGDENMAGYRKYWLHQYERMVRRLMPRARREKIFGYLARVYPKADWLPRFLRAKSTFSNLAIDDLQALYHTQAFLDPMFCASLLHGDILGELAGYDSIENMAHFYNRSDAPDDLSREMYVDIKTYLVDDILTKVDRASMAVGLEVRVPVLDHKFVEFMARIPAALKLRGSSGKYLFKKAVRPILRSDIVDRRKMGFVTPLKEWFRGPLKPMVEETLFVPSANIANWLDMSKVKWIWDQHQAGLRNMDNILWAIMMLEHWARNFWHEPRPPKGPPPMVATPRPGWA